MDADLNARLLPQARLRLAIAVSAAPGAFWASRDAAGKPFGVSVDLGLALAHRLGAPLELVEFVNSSAITAAANAGRWDVTFIPMDDERARKIDFGPVYNIAESTFLVRPGAPFASLAQVDRAGVRIAAVADTTTLRACAQWAKQTPVHGFAGIDEIVAKMRAGEIDAFAMSRDGLTSLAAALPGSRVLDGQFFGAKTAVATPHGRPELLAAASAFINDCKRDGKVREIFDANGMANSPVAP